MHHLISMIMFEHDVVTGNVWCIWRNFITPQTFPTLSDFYLDSDLRDFDPKFQGFYMVFQTRWDFGGDFAPRQKEKKLSQIWTIRTIPSLLWFGIIQIVYISFDKTLHAVFSASRKRNFPSRVMVSNIGRPSSHASCHSRPSQKCWTVFDMLAETFAKGSKMVPPFCDFFGRRRAWAATGVNQPLVVVVSS